MAIGHVAPGTVVPYTNTGGAAIAANTVIEFAAMIGITTGIIAPGATGTVAISEVWTLPKDDNLVITQGDQLYWDTVSAEINKTALNNIPAGKAYNSALLTGTEIQVILNM